MQMFKKSKIFQSMAKLLNGTAGAEVTPASPSSGSPDLQNKEDQPEDQPENVITKVDNTKTLERIAAQSQKLDKAQINAGVKAYSNKDYDAAIAHYQRAVAINPSDGSVYNNIGNVYLRGKNDPNAALPYYVQATTIEPSFNYGWLNLALCQKELGDISGAKTTVAMGLTELSCTDGLYEVLTQLQAQLEQQPIT
jgi:tetratricopeptide (TPR) repeat protein